MRRGLSQTQTIDRGHFACIQPTQHKAPCAQSDEETNPRPPFCTAITDSVRRSSTHKKKDPTTTITCLTGLTLSIRCALTRSRIVMWGIAAAGAAAAAAPPAPAAAAIAFRPVWCGVCCGVFRSVWGRRSKKEGRRVDSARVGRAAFCSSAAMHASWDDASATPHAFGCGYSQHTVFWPPPSTPSPSLQPVDRSDQSVGRAGRVWEGGTGRVVE